MLVYIIIASHKPRAMTVTTAEDTNIILYHHNRVSATSFNNRHCITTFSMYIHVRTKNYMYMHTYQGFI